MNDLIDGRRPTEKLMLNPERKEVNRKFRRMSTEIEAYINTLPDALGKDPFPLTHAFADGVYAREVIIPPNHFLVGSIHKHSYFNFLLSGTISVITEEGFKLITGPATIVSPAYNKRVGYSHTQCVWTTVHPNFDDTIDLDIIEGRIIAENFNGMPSADNIEVHTDTIDEFSRFMDFIIEMDKAFKFDVDRYRDLTATLHSREKVGFWSDWDDEQKKLFTDGRWEEFSKSRGYEDEDIAMLREWSEMNEKGMALGLNPLTMVMDILSRSVAKNILLDTKGEILKSSGGPSLETNKHGEK